MNVERWPAQQPTLAGPRFRMRPWRPEDVDHVLRACQDETLLQWTNLPRPYLYEHAEWFVNEFAVAQWKARRGCAFAIVDEADQVLGNCGIPALDVETGWGGVGYWVAAWARRRGAATEGLRLLSDWAFADAGFRTLQLEIDPRNVASLGVARGSGYTDTGRTVVEQHRGRPTSFTIWQRTRD